MKLNVLLFVLAFVSMAACAATTPIPAGHPADPAAPSTPSARPSTTLAAPAGSLFAPSAHELEGAAHEHAHHHAPPAAAVPPASVTPAPPASVTPAPPASATPAPPAVAPKRAKPKAAAKVFACPMHPEVTSAAPAKCPKCGMNLVEVKR